MYKGSSKFLQNNPSAQTLSIEKTYQHEHGNRRPNKEQVGFFKFPLTDEYSSDLFLRTIIKYKFKISYDHRKKRIDLCISVHLTGNPVQYKESFDLFTSTNGDARIILSRIGNKVNDLVSERYGMALSKAIESHEAKQKKVEKVRPKHKPAVKKKAPAVSNRETIYKFISLKRFSKKKGATGKEINRLCLRYDIGSFERDTILASLLNVRMIKKGDWFLGGSSMKIEIFSIVRE